jgi:hypothetical protein
MKTSLGFKWVLILGGFGFFAGFVGPMILAPDANQGPLLGIFYTGPIGFVAGLALWFLSSVANWSLATQKKIAMSCCGLLACSVAAVGLAPKPDWIGRLYEIEVTGCRASLGADESVVDTTILQEKVVRREKPLFKSPYFRAFLITTKEPEVLSFYVSGRCSDFPSGYENSYFVTDHPQQIRDKAVLEAVPQELSGL